MAVIGEIGVNVVAYTGQLMSGLQKARSAISSFSGNLNSALGGISGFAGAFTGLGAAVSAAGLGVALKARANEIDELNDSAGKLGTTYSSLATLQYAAKMTGTEFGTLEGGLGKLQRNLAEVAATGKGPAAEALAKLRLNASALKEMDITDAFEKVAMQLAAIPNTADRAATAVDLFGKSGQGLMNIIKEAKGGLGEFREEAERLGLTLSGDQVDKVAEFNDQLDRLNAAMDGLKTEILIKLAPGVTETLQGLTDAMTGKNTVIGQQADTSTGGFWDSLARRTPYISSFIGAADKSGMGSARPDNLLTDRQKAFLGPTWGKDVEGALNIHERYLAEQQKTGLSAWMARGVNAGVLGAARGIGRGADFLSGFNGVANDWNKNAAMYLSPYQPGELPKAPGQVTVGLNRAIDARSNEGLAAKAEKMNNQMLEQTKEQTDLMRESNEFLKVLAQKDGPLLTDFVIN